MKRLDFAAMAMLGSVSLIAGCGSSSSTSTQPDNVVATVQVSGISSPLLVGGSAQLAAVAKNAAGDALVRTVTWTSSSPAVATVGVDGTVAALAAGTTTITATTDAKSGNVPVTVNNAAPLVTTISPASATSGSASQLLTVSGSGFVTSSVIRWNGTDLVTTFASNIKLTAQVPSSDFTAATTSQVTVFTPGPGGGVSTAQVFTVSPIGSNPIPAITSLFPASTTAGSTAFALTVNGSNFLNTSTVNWNGTARATTFVSGSRLTVQITAADIATASTATVTVVNPAPGGGASAGQSFVVGAAGTNPTPVITALGPTSAAAGSAAFTLTVTGSNFVSSSTVRWNGATRPTTFVSSTQLTAQIAVSDVATATTAAITVTSPAPGGGVAAAQSFTVFASRPTITYADMPPALVANVQAQGLAEVQLAASNVTQPGFTVRSSGGAGLRIVAPQGHRGSALRRAPGDCPDITPAQSQVDAAGLPLSPITYNFSVSACIEDAANSEAGTAVLTATTPGSHALNYNLVVTNISVHFGDSTGTVAFMGAAVDSVRNATPGTVTEWLYEVQDLNETGNDFGHLVDTLNLKTVFTYTPPSTQLLYNTSMPLGTMVVTQTVHYVIDPGNSFGVSGLLDVVTTTLTPLTFDPTCQNDLKYTGGVLQMVIGGKTTTTTYHACNVTPTTQ